MELVPFRNDYQRAFSYLRSLQTESPLFKALQADSTRSTQELDKEWSQDVNFRNHVLEHFGGSVGQFAMKFLEVLRESYRIQFDPSSSKPDRVGILSQVFAEHLPKEIQKYCKQIPAGILISGDPNAFTMRSPDGDRIVCVDFGLQLYLTMITQVWISAGLAIDSEDTEGLWTSLDQAFCSVSHFYRDALETNLATKVELPYIFLPDEWRRWCCSFTTLQEVFVLAHEFAHNLAGHLDDDNTSKSSDILKGNTKEIEFYNKSQEQEFEADIIAAELFQLFVNNRTDIEEERELELLVPDTVFTFFDFLERCEKVFIDLGILSEGPITHPKPTERRDNVRRVLWKDVNEKIIRGGERAEIIFDIFFKTCKLKERISNEFLK